MSMLQKSLTLAALPAHHTDSGQSVMFLEPHQKPNSPSEPVFSSFSRWSG